MGLNKYFSIAKINFLNSIIYGTDSIISTLFIAVIVFVFINLWTAVYNAGASVQGYTLVMVLWYFVMTESIVTSLSRVLEEIGDEVISGNISNYLNKPYNYIFYKYASTIGHAMFKFFTTLIIGGAIVLAMLGPLKINLIYIPFIFLVCLLAITLHFVITALLGVFAFWFEDAKALAFIYQKILFTAGGMLLPLEVFPLWLETIGKYLPFSYVAYYPAKLFVDFNWAFFSKVILFELGWILFFSMILIIAYKKYIRRLTINGG